MIRTALLVLTVLAACTQNRRATTVISRDAFTRISPEAAGYSAAGLDSLRTFLERAGSESMMLLYDGNVFFEWGDIRRKRLVHSIRKPLLNALIGAAGARPCLNLDNTLASLGITDSPVSLTATEQQATVRQVLQSRSGVYITSAAESEGMAAERPARGSHAPGTFFYYNNWDFNVAGAIYERCADTQIHKAFYEQIAKPIGMLDYGQRIVEVNDGDMPTDERLDGFRMYERAYSQYPAYHFRLSTHDLALFGQLYLNRGAWRGRQLVPAEWIDQSTQPVSIINERYGLAYGMLWDVLVPDAGESRPSFYHTGLGVHMLGVYPRHKLVLVHRVNTEQAYRFDDAALNQMIRLVHGARMSSRR